MNFDEREGKIMEKILDVVHSYARVFNYKYVLHDESDVKKYFHIKDNELIVGINDINVLSIVDSLSFIISFSKDAGLDPLVCYNFSKINRKDYFGLLDIDAEESNKLSDSIEISDNDDVYAKGKLADGKIIYNIKLDSILNLIDDDIDIKNSIDVVFKFDSEEGKLKSSMIMQDLRLNNIICDYSFEDDDLVKIIIDIKEEDLLQGMINVVDNFTKEEKKVSESEIVDYILGVI